MNIVTEAFNKNGGLKKEIKSFFKEMQCYYQKYIEINIIVKISSSLLLENILVKKVMRRF